MKLRPSLSSLRYDLFELANPRDDMFAQGWNSVDGASCSGGETLDGVEYHHVSSVNVGSTANYLVAARELSTVWSLAHDGSGVQWTLSSRLRSTFRFEREADKFYEPHDVRELPNGDVVLVDDGSTRPGCYENADALCFSRAVVYRLDWSTRTVRVVWQFAFPLQPNAAPWSEVMASDVYNNCGGSVAQLGAGRYLVAFTSMSYARDVSAPRDDGDDSKLRSSYVFEIGVDEDDDGGGGDGGDAGGDDDRGRGADDASRGARARANASAAAGGLVNGTAGNATAAAPRQQPRVWATIEIPIPREFIGTQLAYRVVPWKTVVGEAPDSPFEATEPEDANAPAPRPTAAASAAPSSRPSAAPSARPSTPRPSQDSKSHTVWCTAHPEKCDGDDTASYG